VLPPENPLINLKRYGGAAAVVLTAGLCVSAGIGSAASSNGWNGTAPTTLTTVSTGTDMNTPGKNKSFLCAHPLPQPDGTIMDQKFPPFTNPEMPWATGNTLNIAAIPPAPGSVRMKSVFKQTVTATKRHFKGNGIPNHPIGTFPIVPGSVAYDTYSQLPAQGYPNAAAIPVIPYDLDVTVTRTPKVNKDTGRDHWPGAMSVLMAGAGIPGGLIVGATDPKGYYASENIYSPEDFAVSVYSKLGVDPTQVLHTASGRPVQLVNGGRQIKELFV
jgi:hypothetical protein